MGIKKHRPGEIDALYYDKMPQRCKELFWDYMAQTTYRDDLKGAMQFFEVTGFGLPDECKSPIEQILYFALEIYLFEMEGRNNNPRPWFSFQEPIKTNGKTYYADFYFDSDYPDDGYCKYRGKEHLKLVVECDGHDFHEKTKEQVRHNNERNYNLEMEGYSVLHFSGSQIFDDPLKCAEEIYMYINKKVGEWVQKEDG